ncbi:VIT1/CCC1 transporter family protein [Candidatus Micrarchaeota archaeon]|nr:VIT1/CCC1 transporter family protein [Candidatus Micrarchaeota archaeon]
MLASFLKKHTDRFKYYDAITGMSKILRRYFVMNSFDGALTTFGLLLGSFAAQVDDPLLIIQIGIATAIAIGFSGLTGALMTESAERKREIHSMEKALHRKLDHTDYKKAYDSASTLAAVVDGASPLLASLILLSPFFFLNITTAYYVSFGLALSVFFGLGLFLGKMSRENMFVTGIKLLLTGLLCMAVILLLENLSSVV